MPDTPCVLVVDDEPSICWGFESMLSDEGHRVLSAGNVQQGLNLARQHRISMVLLDVRLPDIDGITALPDFISATDNAPVVVMTAFGDLETAVRAVQSGASDYLTKPFKLDDALQMCRKELNRRDTGEASDIKNPQPSQANEGRLVGTSAAMQQAFRQIALVAPSDLSVLITGETGTGKELVAKAIHRHSRRCDRAYVPVAPVSFNEHLIESELFGHAKGAFTGAMADRQGLFESAQGGTILLDEIGDLPPAAQIKLLRVLEDGQFSRVGEMQMRRADVRILAATHRDLHQMVLRGEFREDLFYRLTGVQIHLPPLRDRSEDIELLSNYFLQQFHPAGPPIHESLASALRARQWYGNVRELRNAIAHAAVVARGRTLTIDDFPEPMPGRDELSVKQSNEPSAEQQLQQAVAHWLQTQWDRDGSPGDSDKYPTGLHQALMNLTEPILLELVMQRTGGNRGQAADCLGIHRGTLRERLRSHGME